MLIPYIQLKFVEKVLTSASGEQFRVLFLVTFVNGELKGRVVSVIPIVNSKWLMINGKKLSDMDNGCFLPAPSIENYSPFTINYSPTTKSPYIELYFFNSQPTRAPAFI